MACPGSVRLIEQVPEHLLRGPSPESEEGTVAHAAAEKILHCAGEKVNLQQLRKALGGEDVYVPDLRRRERVSDDMLLSLAPYINYCWALVQAGGPTSTEVLIDMDAISLPGTTLYGTADFVAYDPSRKQLVVVDLKYGRGVLVPVADNPQVKYYALGALLHAQNLKVESVRVCIVQPRLPDENGDTIREQVYSIEDLIAFGVEVTQAAARTLDPAAPLVPGPKQCRWCPAAPICPALRDAAASEAAVEFAKAELVGEPRAPVPVSELTEALEKIPLIEHWIAATRRMAYAVLQTGGEVPGWKLVQKRAVRRVKDEAAVAEWAAARGFHDDEVYDRKLRSVAQLERLIGEDLPATFITRESSGVALASEHDPRPAVQVAEAEFEAE